MTAMVQANLGPPTPKYAKKDPPPALDDPSRQHSSQQPTPPSSLQHSRTGSISQQQPQQQQQQQQQQQRQLPKSGDQPEHSLSQPNYAQPSILGNGAQLNRHTAYAHPGQDPTYYTSHPGAYAVTSTPAQYPSTEAPDLMATAHMQRPPYPPIYHTPQSSSPASVASPQTHDQHGRSLYGQPPQMPQGMYGYPQYAPMNPIHSGPYAPHPSAPPHAQLTSQPLLVSPPVSAPPMQQPMHQPPQQQQQQQQHPGSMQSPRMMKLESAVPQQHNPGHRTPLNPPLPPPQGPPVSAGSAHSSSGSASNSGAAPGPIPATTPLVVRQDTNGVQWIAFEYSRDRVKMEYTIRCDVENINIENLTQEFKTDNCVYPRACCSKDQYRGNRLVYETECNAVGWALAELNPCLRSKRGLIQRAVDSWRNSHQDPRLRSRRVRRMAKANNRKAVSAQHTNHLAGPGGSAAPPPMPASANLNSAPSMPMGGQLHHHHANNPDAPAQHSDEVSGTHEYANGAPRPSTSSTTTAGPPYSPGPAPADSRPAQVFHGYPSYPPVASSNTPAGPSMVPSFRNTGMDHFSKNAPVATSSSSVKQDHEDETSPDPVANANNNTNTNATTNASRYRDLPEGKKRKFILVEDPQRGNRVRVKVMLDQVNMKEIPDSYRKSSSVFPRTYFPVQSPFDQSRKGSRFVDDDDRDTSVVRHEEDVTLGRTLVPAPMLDGEGTVGVPKLSRAKKEREVVLNDMGYRMSWGQSRVFAGRTLFLQRAMDAYRNKMRNSMLTAGREADEIAPHFETRVGKRRFLERSKRASTVEVTAAAAATASTAGGADTPPPAVAASTSSRSAEEVEA